MVDIHLDTRNFPKKYLDQLQNLIERDSRIKLFEFDLVNGKCTNFGQHSRDELAKRDCSRFSTTRIDDDDGIYEVATEVETLALTLEEPFVYSSTWGKKCEVLPDGSQKKVNFEHPSQHGAGLVAVMHKL